ncbi:MAG: YgiT-type zinc finger domain-containing protein [Gammaproteobacteria bacterium]|nr:MAG: YgiT-type zinc finger domain-containing protein [Gammaproteobacteria bacterium]
MKNCSFCGNENLNEAKREYIYQQNGKYLQVRDVPCFECEYCKELYFSSSTLKQIENEFSSVHSGNKIIDKKIIVPTENFNEIQL